MLPQNKIYKSLLYTGQNPLKIFKYNKMDMSLFGIGLLSHSLDYCTDFEADISQKIYRTERTSVKLNFFYLHSWILLTKINKGRIKN